MWFGRLSLDTRSLPRNCLKQRYSARLHSRLYLKFFLLFKEPGNPLRIGSFSLFAYCRYFLAMCFNRFFLLEGRTLPPSRPPEDEKKRQNFVTATIDNKSYVRPACLFARQKRYNLQFIQISDRRTTTKRMWRIREARNFESLKSCLN